MPSHPVNGAAIRAKRLDRGLSVAQLAAAAQVSTDYLYRIESPPCSDKVLGRIADTLGVEKASLRVEPRTGRSRQRRTRPDPANADTEQLAG